jgi:hypothetical protein
MEDNFCETKVEFCKIMDKLDEISVRLDSMQVQLDAIAPAAAKMDTHISFVETVMEKVLNASSFPSRLIGSLFYSSGLLTLTV